MTALSITRSSTAPAAIITRRKGSPAPARAVRSFGSQDMEPGPMRLTRRGRRVLVGLPIVLLVALVMLLGASLTSQAGAAVGMPEPTETVRVSLGQGETLWGLAGEFAPDRDPREFVAEIVELNGLGSSVVQAGQSLAVPLSN
ncbi:LysM peptidoglycan-binding domain-containing protein [Arthrobacter sp. Br18]|uniref:LysM peptidoglycan-binding domain-containing protein n=1 Tax=Arthrobacter sp. Br18 TaxID=1312954 RepID=UPI0004B438B1|nr:LysM peptidoglycan-binding domain-containing protein [Arthrobacter sp. Br18]